MKRVTAYVGSPRKRGNTDVLVDTFLEGAAAAGADTRKFFLAEQSINQCQGCFRACTTRPGIRCVVHRDDMDMLLEELVASDILLFASPLYCAGYTAIMARFFERCLPLWEIEIVGEMGTMDAIKFINNPAKAKKAVIGLVHDLKNPAAGELALKAFESNVGRTYMMDIVAKIQVPDVRDIGDIRKKANQLADIRSLGTKLAITI
jgi:multimeric flavodoxin WrbA